jgi:hypothetical protein
MKRLLVSVAAVALLSSQAGQTRADPIVYVLSNTGQFGTTDLHTGVFTSIGAADFSPESMKGLPGGMLYAVDASSTLRIVDPSTGHSTIVGTLGNNIFDANIRPDGTLFGLSNTGNLYTIDKSTGAVTLVGSTGTTFPSTYDMTFDSSSHLFAVNADTMGGPSNLYSINTTTGAATLVGPVGFRVSTLDFENSTLYGFTFNLPRPILSIDRSTGAGTVLVDQDPALSRVFGAAPTTSAVPEPGGLTLLGIGLAGVLGSAWRRRS